MSGNSPDWLQKDQYFLLNGKKEVVEDYYFTSSPVHNSDNLHIVVKGISHDFNVSSMKPLDARGYSVPKHIKPGKVVEIKDGQLEFVRQVWVKKSVGDKKGVVQVKLSNYPFSLTLDQVKPVSKQNKKAAQKMIKDRKETAERIKRRAKLYRRINRAFF